MQTPNHLQDHVETIAKHEQEFQSSRSRGERIGDRVAAFAGGFPFVAIHVTLFLAWVAMNTLCVGGVRHLIQFPSLFWIRGWPLKHGAIVDHLVSGMDCEKTGEHFRRDERDCVEGTTSAVQALSEAGRSRQGQEEDYDCSCS